MLSFSLHTHRRARTYCCPHGPHRHSPPLPVKAGWRGIKPSLDALLDVAATGSSIKPTSPHDGFFSGSALFAYKINWQSVMFVGYGDDRELSDVHRLSPLDHQVFVKISYAFQR